VWIAEVFKITFCVLLVADALRIMSWLDGTMTWSGGWKRINAIIFLIVHWCATIISSFTTLRWVIPA
jgi:hypothetical protein